jgi:cytidyltransferase-like protein
MAEFLMSESLKKLLSLSPQERAKIRVVLTGGVFDILHLGHLYTLTEAKKYGDFLVVVVARDEHISKKGRKPIHSQEYRAKMVEALKPVDGVVIGQDDPMKIVELIKPDVIVYGYDQEEFLKPEGVKIIKLKKPLEPEKLKTNKIIKELGLY